MLSFQYTFCSCTNRQQPRSYLRNVGQFQVLLYNEMWARQAKHFRGLKINFPFCPLTGLRRFIPALRWSCENQRFLHFKLSQCSECSILSFWWPPAIWISCSDVSEHFVSSIFISGSLLTLSMKMELMECSETSARKIQTLGNHPKERIQWKFCFRTPLGAHKMCLTVLWIENWGKCRNTNLF